MPSFVNALTVDVEDYLHVAALSKSIPRTDWDQYECRVENNTRRLLDMFDSASFKGTFFVLGWVAMRYPALVKEIANRGHEVASHGMSHQLVYDQSLEEFRQETIASKRLLEDLIQQPVLGYRAASYSITQKSLWALDELIDAGFSYDSSIFPIRHDRYGIPDCPREPHYFTAPSGRTILEFPISTAKWAGMNLPVAGGGYFRLLPYLLTKRGLSSINRWDNMPFVFYLHPWEIDPGQPRIPANWFSTFRHYNNLEICEDRLRQLLQDFQFGSLKDVFNARGFPL